MERRHVHQRNEVQIPKHPGKPLPSLTVHSLGKCFHENVYSRPEPFVNDMTMLVSAIKIDGIPVNECEVELAGPMEKLFFIPERTKVGIVTCGGLCPGLNNVIRGLVMNLQNRYGVKEIYGLKYGYEGLTPDKSECIKLDNTNVSDIHQRGGTILGSSRGNQNPKVMAQFLIDNNFNILFTLGGDGTLRGANEIDQELRRRKSPISVIGIPKTIDNDICYTDSTFGFDTAVELSQEAINAVHYEAKSAKNGIGIVKLMGRDAGFIALYASVASGDVNLVLIPEVDVSMDEILRMTERRLLTKGHIVIVIAEGACQSLKPKDLDLGKDKSGNAMFWDAVGYIREQIKKHLDEKHIEHTIKFIDPSYMIRSAPCNASDAHFCLCLANAAVHIGMAGKTGVVVCHHHNNFVSIPIERATYYIKRVNPEGPMLSMMSSIELIQ
ncbi:Pyrophosphate--fructose 6-phosphate 1-phosphotransferase, putative [Entamoeba invadens IP1]|uniref:Pyrophosphate--fructose 6-phosphate 1-phosphotransferase, putative n=1 Tax=Entamoeba invadens IP1 TaxID=370355 RepID=UPI0002C3D27A|nr:Pyrophosphate--fructose 6-phosphate 1-phosphotransferase, putative [Entamoeba invadens IP1]ELP93134.1 Pyrophosphate--fructose 6-phosphate 1-phosphotransferase, putative [Entamoeba invadens IP1]|eukprot:XP_004259905.1 Pyrophosphate--fructose 6-phosphate 1-phosphotransferase, putative [Entamoeba invadens IP1]